MKVQMPSYVKNFKCIGALCKDSCCKDWAVDIDYESYKRYQNVSDPQMRKLLKRYVYKNPYATDAAIDFAGAELTPDKRCSFLDAEGWCLIQKHLGEPMLSNVCKLFPRTYNLVDGQLELALSTSCPEAARLMLSEPDAMTFCTGEIAKMPPIVTYTVESAAKENRGTAVQFLPQIRAELMRILDSGQYTSDEMIFVIERWLFSLGRQKRINRLPDLPMTDGVDKGALEKWMAVCGRMLSELLNEETVDSARYLNFSARADRLRQAGGSDRFEALETGAPQMLRRYLSNLVYRELLPFSESDDVWEGGLLILGRYALIKYHLGVLYDGTAETVIDYIQVFSKVVEHHHTFREEALKVLTDQIHRAQALFPVR